MRRGRMRGCDLRLRRLPGQGQGPPARRRRSRGRRALHLGNPRRRLPEAGHQFAKRFGFLAALHLLGDFEHLSELFERIAAVGLRNELGKQGHQVRARRRGQRRRPIDDSGHDARDDLQPLHEQRRRGARALFVARLPPLVRGAHLRVAPLFARASFAPVLGHHHQVGRHGIGRRGRRDGNRARRGGELAAKGLACPVEAQRAAFENRARLAVRERAPSQELERPPSPIPVNLLFARELARRPDARAFGHPLQAVAPDIDPRDGLGRFARFIEKERMRIACPALAGRRSALLGQLFGFAHGSPVHLPTAPVRAGAG